MLSFNFVTRRVNALKQKTIAAKNETLETLFKISIVSLFCITLIWIAVFLYVAFYYVYVPSIEHIKPVNLHYQACEGENMSTARTVCSFPVAHVELTKSNQILMVGQPYRISVSLDVPESEGNKDLGMFLVCAELLTKKGSHVAHSCRSTMLRYRSPLLHALKTLALGPLYIANLIEQKQTLTVELFSNFEEDQLSPVTDIHIELKSEKLEVYSSKVQIDAHLSGLRYLMFHWPALSATVGVVFNLSVIVFVVVLSWWQIYGPQIFTGREFSFSKLKEKFSPKAQMRHSKNGVLEEEEEKVYLTLRDDLDDGEEEQKLSFMRKLSSSDA